MEFGINFKYLCAEFDRWYNFGGTHLIMILFFSNHNVFKSEISFIIAANHTLSDNVSIIDDPMVKPIVQK